MLQLGLLFLSGVLIYGSAVLGDNLGLARAAAACPLTITAKKDDTCTLVATANGISVSQFLLGNPELTNCRLTEGKAYCIDNSIKGEPPPALTQSQDGTCGESKGITCLGSSYGDCCSKNGYCGKEEVYCGSGCQPGFGLCGKSATAGGSPSGSSTSVSSSKCDASPSTVTTTEYLTIMTEIYLTEHTTIQATITTTATSTVKSVSVSYDTVVVSTVVFGGHDTVTETQTLPGPTVTSVITSTFTSTRISAFVTKTVSTTESVTVTTTVVSTTSPKPSPILAGTNMNCNYYHHAEARDTCWQIAKFYGITLAQLRTWNPNANCDFNPNILGYYLCVGVDIPADTCNNPQSSLSDNPTVCFYSHTLPDANFSPGNPQSDCPLAVDPSARIYTVPSTNLTFSRSCDSEAYGGDLGIFPTQTMQDCMALCAQLNLYPASAAGACEGVTWVYGEGKQGVDTNFCYLKQGVTGTLYRWGTESALLWR